MIPKFTCKTVKGRLILNDKKTFDDYVRSLNDSEFDLILKEKKSQRSLNQNSYYWAVPIRLISEHTGHTPYEVHELLKSMFLKKHLDIDTKEGMQKFSIVKSTTSLNTKEMEEYLSSVRMWASMDLSLSIPEPHEVEL